MAHPQRLNTKLQLVVIMGVMMLIKLAVKAVILAVSALSLMNSTAYLRGMPEMQLGGTVLATVILIQFKPLTNANNMPSAPMAKNKEAVFGSLNKGVMPWYPS